MTHDESNERKRKRKMKMKMKMKMEDDSAEWREMKELRLECQ